jgi:general secretion pathway protein A
MRLLAQRLGRLADRAVASINQSNVADFYRELGDLFNITLRPAQRWNSFKAPRERWIDHLSNNRRRSILLIDEAPEMSPRYSGNCD